MSLRALSTLAVSLCLLHCKRAPPETPPADCEEVAGLWLKISADAPAAERLKAVCKQERFSRTFQTCLTGRSPNPPACIAALPERSMAPTREAIASTPPPVEEKPAPPPRTFEWAEAPPAGALYIVNTDRVVAFTAQGEVKRLAVPKGSNPTVQVASNGAAYLLSFQGRTLNVGKLNGAEIKPLGKPGVKASYAWLDATDSRVVVLHTNRYGETEAFTLSTYDGKRWTHERVKPQVGAVDAIHLASDGALWVVGKNGVARRHGGEWAPYPGLSNAGFGTSAALATSGDKVLVQIGLKAWWRDGDHWEQHRKGIDWSSRGLGANNMQLVAAGDRATLAQDDVLTVSRELPCYGFVTVVDGSGRVWMTANGSIAMASLRDESTAQYPQGPPGGDFDARKATLAVVGGGPALPPMPAVKTAGAVKGTIKVNGALIKGGMMYLAPDTSPKSKPRFTASVYDDGTFTVNDVPEGTYSLHLKMRTSQGREQWPSIAGVKVTAMPVVKVPPFDARVIERPW